MSNTYSMIIFFNDGLADSAKVMGGVTLLTGFWLIYKLFKNVKQKLMALPPIWNWEKPYRDYMKVSWAVQSKNTQKREFQSDTHICASTFCIIKFEFIYPIMNM